MSYIKPIRKWVWLDPGATLDVDHKLANTDMVCWLLHQPDLAVWPGNWKSLKK